MENIRTAMNRGAFDFITKPVNFTDLELAMEKTIRHVAQIRKTIQAIRENNILKMYVDETVLNFMAAREMESTLMANETIEATVAFIDLCGFTAISENEPPDKVVQLLNRYFDIMTKEIIQQGGIIDKFIGDFVNTANDSNLPPSPGRSSSQGTPTNASGNPLNATTWGKFPSRIKPILRCFMRCWSNL